MRLEHISKQLDLMRYEINDRERIIDEAIRMLELFEIEHKDCLFDRMKDYIRNIRTKLESI